MSVLNVLKASLLTVVLLFVTACSPETKVSEEVVVDEKTVASYNVGQDYELVRDMPSATPQIVEHFSLYCGHCYSTEPLIKSLKKTLADDVAFKRSHVMFLPQQRPEWGKTMTFAVASANRLGIEDKFIDAVFDSHFNQSKYLGDFPGLQQLFETLGVDEKTFKATWNDEKTIDAVSAMVNSAHSDNVRFTPDLIVNNKYRIKLSNLPQGAQANNITVEEQLANLVSYLMTNP